MKHLVTYDREVKADIAIALLGDNGIRAVKFGSEISAVEGPLSAFGGVQVMLPDAADYAKAVDVLNQKPSAEAARAEPMPPPAAADPMYYNIASIVIRSLALLLLIDAVVEITYIFENYTRIYDGTIGMANPYRVRVMWEGIRLFFYVISAAVLVGYTDAFARFVSYGIRR